MRRTCAQEGNASRARGRAADVPATQAPDTSGRYRDPSAGSSAAYSRCRRGPGATRSLLISQPGAALGHRAQSRPPGATHPVVRRWSAGRQKAPRCGNVRGVPCPAGAAQCVLWPPAAIPAEEPPQSRSSGAGRCTAVTGTPPPVLRGHTLGVRLVCHSVSMFRATRSQVAESSASPAVHKDADKRIGLHGHP
jgi:hypothetical protein